MTRVGDGDGDGDGGGGGANFVFVCYMTGHATRTLEVVRQLVAAGHDVYVVTAAPEFGVTTTDIASSRIHIRYVPQGVIDCVAVEPDAVTFYRSASLDEAAVPRASILKEEAEWLKAIYADFVLLPPWNVDVQISDVPMGRKGTADIPSASNWESPQVVRDDTSSPSRPSKRARGRSLPPATSPELGVRQKRSTSSPPSPRATPSLDHTTPDRSSKDKTMASAKDRLTPMAVFWDIENCKVPNDSLIESIADNLRKALSMNPAVDSERTTIQAYGNVPASIREGLQRTGITHVDILNKKKDAADKMILVDMFLFAFDNPPPASILLISGDADFAPAARKLVDRGYTIVIALPSQGTAASDLITSGTFAWDWTSLARGEGIVLRRSLPADLKILKTEMIQLFKSHGGFIDVSRIHSEYTKLFGKQIKLSDYHAPKLVDIFVMLGEPFCVFERRMVLLDIQLEQGNTGVPATPASVVNVVSLVNTEEDPYGAVGDMVGAGGSQ